jgi:hypothetical protein
MSRAARLRIAGAGLLALIAVGVWWIRVPDSPGPVPTSAASAADRAEPMSQASATDPTVRPDNLDPTARDPNTDAAAQVEARVAATEATKSATTTHGYRATPEQRTADLAAYLAAENLVALRAAWQARAAQGDADAARSLQQMYDECMGVLFGQNGLPRADRHNANGWPGWLPPDAPARIAALEIGRQRCRGILLELKYEDALRAIARLHREAAALATELGHPDNYLGIPRDRADWPAWGRTRMAALLADGHADAAFAIANSMAGIVARHSEIAWTLAACELGYPCSSTTPFMRYWCVEFGQHCDGAGLIDYYRSGLSPRDWRRALAERNEILRLLRAGDHAALMLPPGQMRGGGG